VDRKRKLGVEEKILDDVDMKTFLEWYRDAIYAHNASQQIMLSSLNRMQDVSLCHCGLPFSMCTCETQSFVETITEVREFFKFWTVLYVIACVLYRYGDRLMSLFAQLMLRSSFRQIRQMVTLNMIMSIEPRVFIQHLGRRASYILRRPKTLLTIVALASTCLILYKMYNSQAIAQSFTGTDGQNCSTKTEDDREDIWYKSDYTLSTFDVNPANLSSKGMSRSEFQKLIGKNIIRLQVQAGNEIMSNNAFCVYGHIYAINRHFIIKGLNYYFTITQNADTNGINGNVKTCLTSNDVLFLGEKNDLAFVQILALPPKKDLRKYLIQDSFRAKAPGFIYRRDFDGTLNDTIFKGCEFIERTVFPKLNIELNHGIEAKFTTNKTWRLWSTFGD
jgi:hypothetical protein